MFNITYITMLYGVGLPILFPIAILSFIILYCVERYQVAKIYKMPPAMDAMLTKNALRRLSFSPLLLLINGYWMLSNLQIFGNTVNRIDKQGDRMATGHNLDSATYLDQATPLLLAGVPLLGIIVLQRFFYP